MTTEHSVQRMRYPAPGLGIAFPSAAQVYLAPADLLSGAAARGIVESGRAVWFGGTEQAFCCAYLVARAADKVSVYRLSVREVEGLHPQTDALLETLQDPLPDFAGLPMDRPHVMGIVNVTPDSFSDGGERIEAETAIAAALAMADAGATIIDVGGESTRPGAAEVPPEEEIRRVAPVVRALAERGVCVSVDTRHAATMAAAVEAGARIINDVTALAGDPEALRVARASGVDVVLMHMRGEPQTMQADPVYDCAPFDVFDYLRGRVAACAAAGIERKRLCVDPGIGFGKTMDHNLSILRWLSLYRGLGVPVLLGASRKSLIARVCGDMPPKARLPGSLAIALAGLRGGANIVRVHDVAETVQAVRMQAAIDRAE
ncbi:dihydropteroate synthase [Oleispirillum naphthae]|uniref:dihydropteroate synthase n=1 Tax=Oleispirillum naphthae TaxID=2838853 RepID=UPI0030825644